MLYSIEAAAMSLAEKERARLARLGMLDDSGETNNSDAPSNGGATSSTSSATEEEHHLTAKEREEDRMSKHWLGGEHHHQDTTTKTTTQVVSKGLSPVKAVNVIKPTFKARGRCGLILLDKMLIV